MPDKIASHWEILTCSGIFASIGGGLHYILKCKEGKKFSWKELLLHSAISAFAGLISFEVLAYLGLPSTLDGALCGLAGWSATRLLRISELLMYNKSGLTKEEVENDTVAKNP